MGTSGAAIPDLTLACAYSDRTVPLRDGSVRPEGVRLIVEWHTPTELFARQLRTGEFDVSEMSLSAHAMRVADGDTRFIAIPVFLARVFRHSAIYLNAAAGIGSPRDLIGRRVGTQSHTQTAAVWVRGILWDEHGVRPEDVEWRDGPYAELDAMLRRGDIDGLIGATPPPAWLDRDPRVVRLFPNAREIERDYFRRTGIFPIMHTVVVRRELVDRHPRLARSLYDAFNEAKRIALERLHARTATWAMPPWLDEHVHEEAPTLLAPDPYAYGLEPNRHVLGTFLRYMHEQSLTARPVQIEELFHPETLAT